MSLIENRTFDEIQIGESASLSRTLTRKDIELFAIMSGDVNPAHVDEEFARSDMFHKIIAHGMWGAALISTVLGTELPGPGTIYLGQTLRFRHPIAPGDTVVVTVKVRDKDEGKHRVHLDCQAVNQAGEVVIDGTAEVIAPTEKISRPRVVLPEVELRERGRRYRQLIEMTRGMEPIRTAVVHPVDAVSLIGAIEAGREKLIVPVLVGPEDRIRAAAEAAKLDLGAYEVVPTEHSEAAAAQAVAMARAGKVEALMKGALHTDELMRAVVDGERGLRTHRRISHVFAMDVPGYPRPLFITDAAINIYPDARGQARHRAERDRSGARARDRDAKGRDPVGGRDGHGDDQVHARRRRALQDGRPRADHRRHRRRPAWPSTTRSRRRRPKPRASSRRSPARPTSSWCPTSRPGTCWRSSSNIWPRPKPPASSSARAFRSFSPAVPTRRSPGSAPAQSRCCWCATRRR